MLKKFKEFFPQIHESAFIAENAVITGAVEIAEDASVWYGCVLRGDVNFIRIGARTNIQDAVVIHVSTGTFPTIVGTEVTVGHQATLHGCTIEDRALIGIGAIVLDGAVVGHDSLVAAGSLVTPGTIIPPRSMVMGSPAKVKREMSEVEIKDLEKFWRGYVLLKEEYKR